MSGLCFHWRGENDSQRNVSTCFEAEGGLTAMCFDFLWLCQKFYIVCLCFGMGGVSVCWDGEGAQLAC